MTPGQIAQRLAQEFPGRTTCLQIECRNYAGGPTVELIIYDDVVGHIYGCKSVEDAFQKMKDKINPPPPSVGEEIVIEKQEGAEQ
jgi:hypothetical protein